MKLLSVDPAITCTGWAIFDFTGSLESCGIIRSNPADPLYKRVYGIADELELLTLPANQEVEVALEMPQIYVGSKLKGDPNDLLPLAMIAGALLALKPVKQHYYKPREWKGQVPKDAMIKRIEKRLTPAELSVINEYRGPEGLKHNMMDAIGIGLHHIGRL